ncbi:hypothetical protein ATCC90586_005305 [Pythium insidiosum]|nr:hypothetical protein ATCC90586_005305 [Pythium insidiosum]
MTRKSITAQALLALLALTIGIIVADKPQHEQVARIEDVSYAVSASITGCGLCQQTGYCDHAFRGNPAGAAGGVAGLAAGLAIGSVFARQNHGDTTTTTTTTSYFGGDSGFATTSYEFAGDTGGGDYGGDSGGDFAGDS